MLSKKDFNELKEKEESLWIEETRFNQNYMEQILAPSFFEFGRSGRIHSREEVLNAPKQKIRATLPLKNFEAKLISENVALLTYQSEVEYETLEIGNRSSLWKKTETGWQLTFHQGTPTN